MKTIDQWLDEYGESHMNKTNKIIHTIFVPIIMFSVFGILWSIPLPNSITYMFPHKLLNIGTLFMLVPLFFYLRLSVPLFIGFLFISAAIIAGNAFLYEMLGRSNVLLAVLSVIIFVVSWVFQFVGHKIEGKSPSFFKDLQFFLIGPAWLLHFAYRMIGIPYKLS